jgi:bleomycin hydrolase
MLKIAENKTSKDPLLFADQRQVCLPPKEFCMKKSKALLFLSLFIVFLMFPFTACRPKERIGERKVVQIGGKDLQTKDEVIYKSVKYKGPDGKEKEYRYPSLDFSGVEKPVSLKEFTRAFYLPPLSQGGTLTCWCFATTSLLESELKRLGKPEVKLSEMYTVYWEFVENARRYVQEKGNSVFLNGSEHNAVTRQMKAYGAVRESDYSGLLGGATQHNHGPVSKEIKDYLEFCKKNEYWDEEKAIDYIKSILNKHLGAPPKTIDVNGEQMTPQQYLADVLQLAPDDYVAVMSLKEAPFYTKAEFEVPDNWWHSKDYYNVPLDDFYGGILNAVKNGYTVSIGGDISEPGNNSGDEGIAIIPSFDLPQVFIDQDSREFRFKNTTTTDDHYVHIVGYKDMGDHAWFLIKDSAGGGKEGEMKGLYFMRDDYIKLKILTFMVHKDAVKDLLAKSVHPAVPARTAGTRTTGI